MPGDGSSTSTNSSTSWMSQPGIKEVLGTAKGVFDSGKAWTPNTSSMVSPFSTQQTQGLTGLQNAATSSAPAFNQNFNTVNKVVGDGGLNNLQDQQVARLQQMYGGIGGSGLNQLQANAYNAFQPTANGLNAEQQNAYNLLNPIAQGKDRQNNPYLDDVINRSAGDIGDASNLMASAAGRYGSGSHQGVTQKAVGDMSSGLRFTDYNNQQSRMDNAINQLFGMGSQGSAQRMAGLGQQAGLATQGESQRRDALGSLYNAGTQQRQNQLAGTQQLTDAYNAKLAPYQTMLGVGQQYQNQHQNLLKDNARILQENKNSLTDPVNWLANLAGAFQGGQQVTSGTTTQPGQSDLSKGIGGGLATLGATGNPLLGLLGGLGGIL